jgi:hypothetical protein
MALATTALAASIAATAIGTGVSMYAASQQAAAQQAALNYQAQVARNNATIDAQNAAQARNAGETQAENQLLAAGQRTSMIRAAAAANGLDANTGTPASLQSDQEKLGMLDALTDRNNADQQAYSYETGAMSNTAQAGLYGSEAANAGASGMISGFNSLISGASSVSNKWLQYQEYTGSGGGGGGLLAEGN